VNTFSNLLRSKGQDELLRELLAGQYDAVLVDRDSLLHRKHDPNYTDYPINSHVLYTAPTGPSDKLELKHRGPYQVIIKLDSICTIQV
jgi:ABC-type amino acid transport substrate-binding protein